MKTAKIFIPPRATNPMKRIKTGIAFPDFISTEKKIFHKAKFEEDLNTRSIRGYFLFFAFIIFTSIIFIKVFNLQIIKGKYYRELSDSNRIRTKTIYSERGIIFDRNNSPLVFNVPGFRKTVKDKTILLTQELALKEIAKGDKNLEIDSLREYPYKEEFAHVLGYIGQISKEELDSRNFSSYKGGDLIGKMGIEKEYEKVLKGIDGKELVEVDSAGKVIRTLGKTTPAAGKDIKLTLDKNIQKKAYEALKDVKKGAVIVSSPKGEILALISKPSFDPNLFTLDNTYEVSSEATYKELSQVLLDDKNQPLLNRAIGGVYPPGSTFKLITAASGLENKLIDKDFTVKDTGIIRVGNFSYSNWLYTKYGGRTDGDVNVVKGIKRSNDIFFYKLAEKVGVDKISETAKKFGLGSLLGIDLEGEEKGIVPTQEWKRKAIGEQWYLGDTYHYGIGQGYLLTTPLQINAMTQAVANGGMLYQPHLFSSKFKVKSSKLLNENSFRLIRQGMIESCQEGGVAWPLFKFKVSSKGRLASGQKNSKFEIDGKNFYKLPESTSSANLKDYVGVSIACKTGTAEHKPDANPHAWITLFAPAYNPEIVVTVLVEEGGEGSNVAAPIAKKVLEEFFGK